MKKQILLLALLAGLIFTTRIQAQFTVGIKVGYNASSLGTSLDSIKAKMSSGFHIGAFARLGKRVQLQPELCYTISGGTYEIGQSASDWKQKVTVGSLDIPVLLSFTLIKSDLIKWRLMAGPEVSFVVNSNVENLNLTGPIQKSDLKTTTWYIQAGTGIDIWRITVDIRYQGGLNSLIGDVTQPANGYTTPYPINSGSNLFLLSAGFKIL